MNIYNAVPGEAIPLGRRWEHKATRIVFDISAWVDAFGAGNVRLLHQRQGDAAPYPVAITRADADGTANNETGTLILWDVTRTDTAKPLQYGKAELRYYAGNEGAERFLVKSELYKTSVLSAMGATLAEAPASERSWLDELLAAAKTIEENTQATLSAADNVGEALETAQDAADAANAAKEAAETAQEAAQEAAREATDAARAAQLVPASDIPFSNDEAITLSNGGAFVTIIDASYAADAGTTIGVQGEIQLSVMTAATGSANSGWTALSDATVTVQYAQDDMVAPSVTSAQTLYSGDHILRLQRYFGVMSNKTHNLALQLRITGGGAVIAAGGATIGISGARAVE